MDYPKPSAFTPFLRRFTNERQRELDETRQLYAWVKRQQDGFTETKLSIGSRIHANFDEFPHVVRYALAEASFDLITAERYIWELPEPEFGRWSMQEFVEYRNLLHAKQYFFMNQERILQSLDETLRRVLFWIACELPEFENPSPFRIPLIYALPEPKMLVEKTYAMMLHEAGAGTGMFRELGERLTRNLYAVSGRAEDGSGNKPIRHAGGSELPLDEVVRQYLGGTPFHDIFMTPVPLKLTHDDRMNHMHVVGGTNAGKTTLIESLLLHDIRAPDSPSLVVVDPTGDLFRRLLRADLGIEDRIIYINPRDIERPPALNIFSVNRERMAQYGEEAREKVMAGVIQTFDYLFEGLGADITAKQSVFFRYVIRLMLSLPETMGRNATILDMMELMVDPAPYSAAIEAQPRLARDFFLRDFMHKQYVGTREQLRYRIQLVIQNATMERLLTAPETKIDLFDALNSGKIVLVDTAKDLLLKEGSSAFGKFFISLVLRAIFERTVVDEGSRKDTFLVIDEAANYFSSDINEILNETRKFRCGLLLAHHYLGEAPQLVASLMTNAGSKFVSMVSATDARAFAREMRTTEDFIMDQPVFHFAAHMRNATPQAVSIPVRPPEDLPQLSPAAFALLMERNRERVSMSPQAPPEPPPSPSPQPPDEDISKEW